MSKLPKKNQFLDVSDYGRPIAKIIANTLKNTPTTPVHVTLMFVVSGLLAIACIIHQYYWLAAFFLVLKSILDAADGELARVKNTPSYTGRYLDSISDIILNLLILLTICYSTDGNIILMVLAFFGMQLQGTLYNYYYVILRNKHNGDTTSRIFENQTPKALAGERQQTVTLLFKVYQICYGLFDRIIYRLDTKAARAKKIPNWFMTLVSTFGLGFQLLIIGVLLILKLKSYIIPFFMFYSFFIILFIGLRRWLNR